MNEPDYSHGYLRIPLSLWAALFCRAPLTRRQLQLVAVILRESWGWQNRKGEPNLWTRPLSSRQFALRTGLSTDRIQQDLVCLRARGLLHEARHRYQLVPDPKLWITPGNLSLKRRPATSKPPGRAAETALLPPEPKKEPKDKRVIDNGFSHLRKLSTGVDNQAVRRLATLLTLFTDPLTRSLQRALHAWVRDAGVARVWSILEPGLRESPAAAMRLLQRQVAPYEEHGRGARAGRRPDV